MEQRNLFIAIAVSIAILIGFQYVSERMAPPAPAPTSTQPEKSKPGAANAPSGVVPPGASTTASSAKTVPLAQVLAASPRVPIDTPLLEGSINLDGGRIDNLTLRAYHETVNPKSPTVVVLAPEGSEHPYFVQLGWVSTDPHVKVPGTETHWIASGGALTPTHPIDLTWDNGAGLKFTEHVAVDKDYMFTVTDSVANSSDAPVTLYPYARIRRTGAVPASTEYSHVGPIAVLNDRLYDGGVCIFGRILCDDYNYDDVKKAPVIGTSKGGWLGFTDQYWLTALIPPQHDEVKTSFHYVGAGGVDSYQAAYVGSELTVKPDKSVAFASHVFVGAKVLALLDHYNRTLQVPQFDRAIDFGIFYFITKPIFRALDFFNGWLGNFGLAIMLFTLLIKLIFFPLANKSYRAMSKMKKLQPEVKKLREQYGDDKQKLNQETMALYKRIGANPMAGCLPIIIQIPVFWSLYKVLYVTIEMWHAPFYGWIHDLSAPDPTTFVNLFGLLPFHPPAISFLHIGAWPIIMGITMFLQQKLNPQPADPVQAKMFMILPVVFTIMLAQFAVGLVIYWSWNNLLSIAQQWVIMRRTGVT